MSSQLLHITRGPSELFSARGPQRMNQGCKRSRCPKCGFLEEATTFYRVGFRYPEGVEDYYGPLFVWRCESCFKKLVIPDHVFVEAVDP